MGESTPLSAQDRLRVYQILSGTDAALAARVSDLLDGDPVMRLLADQASQQFQAQAAASAGINEGLREGLREIKYQMRQLMLVLTFISVVAMCLNAGLVGVSVTMSGAWGTFSTRGSASASKPLPLPPDAPHPEP